MGLKQGHHKISENKTALREKSRGQGAPNPMGWVQPSLLCKLYGKDAISMTGMADLVNKQEYLSHDNQI